MSWPPISPHDRHRFDALLDEVMASLPDALHALLEEVPLIVEDHPSPALEREFGSRGEIILCGLHAGTPLTERTVDNIPPPSALPDHMMIFRTPIIALTEELVGPYYTDDDIHDQIRITVLHEIGHHFGLDEDDLDNLGYA